MLDAAKKEDWHCVAALLKSGEVDVNYRDSLGWTAVLLAANYGQTETVTLLLDGRAKFEYSYRLSTKF